MPSWLITGSNRGVGLAMVQNLLEKDTSNFVIATARNVDTAGLKELKSRYPKERLQLIQLDVANPESVERAVEAARPLLLNGLDYLVQNAGVHLQPLAKVEDIDYDLLQEEILFNTVAPIRLTRLLLPLTKISKEKKVVFISSVMASFDKTYEMVDQCNAYSIGKAALNMVARKWSASLKYEGIAVAAIHPGWVRTEIGDPIAGWMSENAPDIKQLEPDVAGAGVVKVIENFTLEKTGEFWNWDGASLPW